MAFRRRNIAVGRNAAERGTAAAAVHEAVSSSPGVRPSPLTSYPVTSSGSPSLDGLLGGHAGLALGSSLLIEESGTTDFAGALLKYYAAEGIFQGHVLHIVGMGDGWVRELPGVAEEKSGTKSSRDDEKMKIAWRYESLGQAGDRERAPPLRSSPTPPSLLSPSSFPSSSSSSSSSSTPGSAHRGVPFCHTFDLTKRIPHSADAKVNHVPFSPHSELYSIIEALSKSLAVSQPHTIHRLVLPSLLSPALYSPTAGRPESFLAFFRSLRALLKQYDNRLTAIISLPLELYPRKSALVRWAELLSDGVLELTPFPHLMDASNNLAESGGARGNEEQPQGLIRVHKLPISTDRGEGGAGAGNSLGEDLAFSVSRRKFAIKPFSLPPLEGDHDAQKDAGVVTAKDVEF